MTDESTFNGGQVTHQSFTRIAPFYDALMRGVPYEMWVGYFELLCVQNDHTARRVLDVCCGTGTMCELLTEKAYFLTGVDISTPMILSARTKAAGKGLRIDYFDQDIAQMSLGSKFDTAFSFFDSLNYITDPGQLRQGILRIAEHLGPGGLFMFDLNTEFAFTNQMFDQQQLTRKAAVRYRWKSKYDADARICTVKMDFWAGEPEEHFVETHIQRAHSPEEIRSWLTEAGFEEIRSYNSYTLDKPTRTSDRVHYTAIRR